MNYSKLRPCSGVLDWMTSPSLTDVNRLLTNRFQNFLNSKTYLLYIILLKILL
ncbi:hypothetical protein F6Y03_01655 [Bacillus megaterium]|nr:hypothetical protein [Priestia megaterium]